jgi:hypothetical protein
MQEPSAFSLQGQADRRPISSEKDSGLLRLDLLKIQSRDFTEIVNRFEIAVLVSIFDNRLSLRPSQ